MTKKKGGALTPQAITDDMIVPTELADRELEEAVLGVVMLEISAIEMLGSSFGTNLFYYPEHVIICKAILELFLANDSIDILTVTQKLKSQDNLKKVGGPAYISQLTGKVASSLHTETHVRILQQYYLGRHINLVCNKAKYEIFNPGNDVFDVYEGLQRDLENALKDLAQYQVSSAGDIHLDLIKKGYDAINNGSPGGVLSGLNDVDNYTNGWQPSDLIILAGRPGMGKTAFALALAIFPALERKDPVAFFTLEMSKEQLTGRIQSSLSGIPASRIIKKQVTIDELNYIDQKCKVLYDAPLFIDDTPNISLVELKTKCRKLVRESGVKMIVIDYLQLMRSGLNLKVREQEIAQISMGLKALAKELSIPVIALSQLSRNVEGRGDKKPMLSDLRESGQIEQDADMVMFAYRPEYYGLTEYEIGGQHLPAHKLFMCIVAKHRNGGIGEIALQFEPELIKVSNQGWEPTKDNYAIPGQSGNSSNTSIENNKGISFEKEFGPSNTNVDEDDDDDLPF